MNAGEEDDYPEARACARTYCKRAANPSTINGLRAGGSV